MRGLPVHVNTVIWKKELKKGRNKQRRRRRRRKEQESAEAISGLKNWVLLDFSSDFWLFDCQTFWAKLIKKSLQRNVLLIKKFVIPPILTKLCKIEISMSTTISLNFVKMFYVWFLTKENFGGEYLVVF